MSEATEQPSVVNADPAELLQPLEHALSGAGPPVAPLGNGVDRTRMLSAIGPDMPVERDGIAVILPTSGSTGSPKGVLLPASALTHSAQATLDRLGGPGQWLLALPVDRIAGLQVLVRSLLAGTRPVTPADGSGVDGFVAATDQLTAGTRYTALVPTQLVRLLDAGAEALEALRSYDAILLGGAAARSSLLERTREAGLAVVTTYGMTETCGGCVYDGTPLDDVHVELDSHGRIRIAGPVLSAGYRGGPAIDGWFTTADLGRIDEDGRLDVLGRTDDVVLSGGVNVPLQAVEEALSGLPAIADVAVVGVPDAVWGSRVVACVVVREGAEPPTLQAIRDRVAALHPKAYAPRKLVLLDALPMLSSGKVDRLALSRWSGP